MSDAKVRKVSPDEEARIEAALACSGADNQRAFMWGYLTALKRKGAVRQRGKLWVWVKQ